MSRGAVFPVVAGSGGGTVVVGGCGCAAVWIVGLGGATSGGTAFGAAFMSVIFCKITLEKIDQICPKKTIHQIWMRSL